MRSLEGIIAMNARAAGREAGHADTDGNDRLVSAIHAAVLMPYDNEEFTTGFLRGRSEG